MVANNQSLRRLLLNCASLELAALSDFLAKLQSNQALETLSLDRPILPTAKEDGVAQHFAKLLLSHSSLAHLSLKQHGFFDQHAQLLADALYRNNRMLSLNLEANKIGVIGAEALASCLLAQGASSLQYLGLSYNHVCDDGAVALAEALKANASALRVLTLKNNCIGHAGLHALAQVLESSTSLEQLYIFGNDFDNDVGQQFHTLLQHRLPYANVVLDIRVYVVDGAYMIGED